MVTNKEVRTSVDIDRSRRKRSCGPRGEHKVRREKMEDLVRRKYWTDKLCCCCISGRFWVGVSNQNTLKMYITLHLMLYPLISFRYKGILHPCSVWIMFSFIDLSESNDTLGSTAVQKARGFYHSCLDTKSIETAGAEPFLKLIQKVRWLHAMFLITSVSRWEENPLTIIYYASQATFFQIFQDTNIMQLAVNIAEYFAFFHLNDEEWRWSYSGFASSVTMMLTFVVWNVNSCF